MNIWQTVFSLFVAVVGLTDGASIVEERKLQAGALEQFLNGILAGLVPLEFAAGGFDVTLSTIAFDNGLFEESDEFEGLGDIIFTIDEPNDQSVIVSVAANDIIAAVSAGALVAELAVNSALELQFTSPDFSSALPTSVSFAPGYNCVNDLVVADAGAFFNSLLAAGLQQACTPLEEALASLNALLTNEIVLASQLPPISSDIAQAVAAGEAVFAAPAGFEFFDQAELDAVFENLLNELENLPFIAVVEGIVESIEDLGGVFGSGNDALIAETLSGILTELLGDPVVISAADIEGINFVEILTGLQAVIDGSLAIDVFIGNTLVGFGVPIPSDEQISNIIAALPPTLQGLVGLIPLDDVFVFLDTFGSDVNISDIIEFFDLGESVDIPLDQAVIIVFNEITVEFVLFEFAGPEIPEEVFVVLDILGIALDDRIIDVIDDLVTELIGFLATLGIEVFPPPEIILERRLQTVDVGTLIAPLLFFLTDLQLVSLNLDPLGQINVTLNEVELDLVLEFVTDNLGLLGQSSVGLPGVSISDSSFIGVSLTIDINGFLENIDITLFFEDVFFQFAPTFALNYDNLLAFGFAEGVDLKAIADVAADLAGCAAGSVAIDFSTFAASLGVSLELSANIFSEVTVFIEEAIGVVNPGLSNAGLNLASLAIPLLEFSELTDSCNDLSLTFVGDNDDDDDGDDDGIFGSLGDEVGFAIVGVGALFILVIVLFALGVVGGRGKPKAAQAAAAEEGKQEAAAKAPMADTVGEKDL